MLDFQLMKQRDRLIDLLSFAQQNVPHYRKNLPPNIRELVSDAQQWQKIPMLEKKELQTNWNDFLSKPNIADDQKVAILHTSGSTGTPLKIARPKSELLIQTKHLWAHRANWFPKIMHWKMLNLFLKPESAYQNVLRRDEKLDLSFSALPHFCELIEEYQPDWMYGPPSAVYRLAEYFREKRQSIPTLKLIETTGEQLLPYQRTVIENVFRCSIANQYGCREFWVLSYECPARSMHAWTDELLIEVVHNGQSVNYGETGELVVTSLSNRIMPLIRYKVGDIVCMNETNCTCGDRHPILTPVDGRTALLIVTPTKTYPPAILNAVFSQFILRYEQSILEFQVIQIDYDLLEINLVPGKNFKNLALELLQEDIYRLLPGVKCKFVLSSAIPNQPSGKTPTFISRITSFQNP